MKLLFRIAAYFLSLIFGVGIGVFFVRNSTHTTGLITPILEDLHLVKKFEVIGFSPYWLIPKQRFDYADVLTTWTYFGLVINPDGTIQKLVADTEEEPGWTTLKGEAVSQELSAYGAKQKERSLLLHLSNEDDIGTLISDATASAVRLTQVVTPILSKYGFSDLNLDIESFRDASESARQSYGILLSEIKKRLGVTTLTVELTPTSLIRTHLADPTVVGNIADRVILMAYDYLYSGSLISGPVAPLFGAGSVRVQDVSFSLDRALSVIDSTKLVLGIPLYGYEWDALSTTPGNPVVPGTGKTASWSRVKELLSDCPDCISGRDNASGDIPYVTISENGYVRQMFYEDASSITTKIAVAREKGIAGVAFWALGYEGENLSGVLQ